MTAVDDILSRIPLTDLAKRMPVILSTRTGAGPVLQQTYGFPGSETDLVRRGALRVALTAPAFAEQIKNVIPRSRAARWCSGRPGPGRTSGGS